MPYNTTAASLASLWKKHVSTVTRALQRGEYKVNGRARRIPAQQIGGTWYILDSWFEEEKKRLNS